MLLVSIPQALCYFDEAEESAAPICLKNHNWEEIKIKIQNEVRNYLA